MKKLEHLLNPLHIYCRLRDLKIEKQKAKRMAKHYEIVYNIVNHYLDKGGKGWYYKIK